MGAGSRKNRWNADVFPGCVMVVDVKSRRRLCIAGNSFTGRNKEEINSGIWRHSASKRITVVMSNRQKKRHRVHHAPDRCRNSLAGIASTRFHAGLARPRRPQDKEIRRGRGGRGRRTTKMQGQISREKEQTDAKFELREKGYRQD